MIIVIVVLLFAALVARAIGHGRRNSLNSWPAAVRVGLAAMFLFTGVMHFVPAVRDTMVFMVPASLPNPELIVAFTGICEIFGAVGLLLPRTRVVTAWALIAFLVAVFPANVRAAREKLMMGNAPATPFKPRLAVQALFIGLVWWSGVRRRRD